MSRITESSKSQKEKQKLFSQAGMIAVSAARNKGLPITYASGNSIVREYPDGRTEVIATIEAVSQLTLPKTFSIK